MQPLALAQPLGALLRAGRGVRHAVWLAVGGGRPVEARACGGGRAAGAADGRDAVAEQGGPQAACAAVASAIVGGCPKRDAARLSSAVARALTR